MCYNEHITWSHGTTIEIFMIDWPNLSHMNMNRMHQSTMHKFSTGQSLFYGVTSKKTKHIQKGGAMRVCIGHLEKELYHYLQTLRKCLLRRHV